MNRWLTPNTAGGVSVRRVLSIPPEFLPSVNGALQELAEVYNWEKQGTLTPAQAAAAVAAMLEDYYVSNVTDDINGKWLSVPPWRPTVKPAAWQFDGQGSQFNAGAWRTGTGDPANSIVSWTVPMGVGAWTVRSLTMTNSQCGIWQLFIDNAYLGQVDYYSGVQAFNVIKTSDPFVCPTAGFHVLKYACVGKNPSSSNYRIYLSDILLECTS